MQEEIKELYEKIKDQLSEEEFSQEIEKVRENLDDVVFLDDYDIAKMVLENHGIDVNVSISDMKEDSNNDEMPFEISTDDDDVEETGETESFGSFGKI